MGGGAMPPIGGGAIPPIGEGMPIGGQARPLVGDAHGWRVHSAVRVLFAAFRAVNVPSAPHSASQASRVMTSVAKL